jgi:hypothetical protein
VVPLAQVTHRARGLPTQFQDSNRLDGVFVSIMRPSSHGHIDKGCPSESYFWPVLNTGGIGLHKSADLLGQSLEIEIVPGFDNLSIFDSDYGDPGEFNGPV